MHACSMDSEMYAAQGALLQRKYSWRALATNARSCSSSNSRAECVLRVESSTNSLQAENTLSSSLRNIFSSGDQPNSSSHLWEERRKFKAPFPLTVSVPLVPPSRPPAGALAQGVPIPPAPPDAFPTPGGWL